MKKNPIPQQAHRSIALLCGMICFFGGAISLVLRYCHEKSISLVVELPIYSRLMFKILLFIDNLLRVYSLSFLLFGGFAIIFSVISKKTSWKITLLNSCLGIITAIVVLLSLNNSHYFAKQYNSALNLMENKRYENATSCSMWM